MTTTKDQSEIDKLRAALEAAFRDGYKSGYSEGGSDQCSYEWGCGSKCDSVLKRNQDREWKDSDTFTKCPVCGSENTDSRHHDGTAFIFETDWRQCEDCEAQWDHQ